MENPTAVRYFASLIYSDESKESAESVTSALIGVCGPTLEVTEPVSFLHTSYYTGEFGPSLRRHFILFDRMADRSHLSFLKGITHFLEKSLSMEGRRRVNIDPGFVSLEQVVLASAKGFSHKVYLGNGVYADVALTCRDRTFRPLPWTFPDYASPETIKWFNKKREDLLQVLRTRERIQLEQLLSSSGEVQSDRVI
ncbi:MAG: DUF4416 family protein [Deltaproteobacteria bacterium]|nr:DUF4416 family protein [Deltaproteobacteria bacterium]